MQTLTASRGGLQATFRSPIIRVPAHSCNTEQSSRILVSNPCPVLSDCWQAGCSCPAVAGDLATRAYAVLPHARGCETAAPRLQHQRARRSITPEPGIPAQRTWPPGGSTQVARFTLPRCLQGRVCEARGRKDYKKRPCSIYSRPPHHSLEGRSSSCESQAQCSCHLIPDALRS
jgi:hypothetical protein